MRNTPLASLPLPLIAARQRFCSLRAPFLSLLPQSELHAHLKFELTTGVPAPKLLRQHHPQPKTMNTIPALSQHPLQSQLFHHFFTYTPIESQSFLGHPTWIQSLHSDCFRRILPPSKSGISHLKRRFQ